MLKIGLTGGIGSGKSVVSKLFAVLGVPVYDADSATKRLYATDPALQAAMKLHFGNGIYNGNVLDRTALAALVFGDPEKLELLNSITHPPTIADAQAWMEAQAAAYIVKESALLFESGSVAGLDYVIGVDAPVALRIQRVMQREGLSREAVQERMKRQIDAGIKMKLCDFVLKNDEQELLLPQVIALHEKLLSLA